MTAATAIGAFVRRDLRVALSYRAPFAFDIIALLFALLEFWFLSKIVDPGQVNGDYFPFIVLGLVATSILAAALIAAAMTLRQEQVQGTLEVLLTSGIRSWLLVVGLAAYPLATAFVRSFLLIALVVAIEPAISLTTANLSLATVALGLGAASFVALGMLTSSLVILFRQGAGAASWLMTMLVFLGGMAFPLHLLPGWLRPVSHVSPLTEVLRLTRDALLTGTSWREALPTFVALVVITIVYGLIGTACISATLRHARRKGTLSLY